jgi:hypothetical protein
MPLTLEERVEQLERKVVQLSANVPNEKPWRRTFGMSRGDPGFEEMLRLGREYRQALREPDEKC